MIEYDTNIYILKPVNLANGNHRIWYEINNRGGMNAYARLNTARFAKTKAERTANDDPAALARRALSDARGVCDGGAECGDTLKAQRLLLDEDVEAYVQRAESVTGGTFRKKRVAPRP